MCNYKGGSNHVGIGRIQIKQHIQLGVVEWHGGKLELGAPNYLQMVYDYQFVRLSWEGHEVLIVFEGCSYPIVVTDQNNQFFLGIWQKLVQEVGKGSKRHNVDGLVTIEDISEQNQGINSTELPESVYNLYFDNLQKSEVTWAVVQVSNEKCRHLKLR